MSTIAIIIPYFQEKAGVLRRALTSVVEQNLSTGTRVHIIVVDDGSPAAADPEVAGLNLTPAFKLTVIKQTNKGVSEARNLALRQINKETDYVAFIDSDDIWSQDYLFTALSALERGYDFFFCDTKRLGNIETSFSEKSFDQFLLSSHAMLISDKLYEIASQPFLSCSLEGRAFRLPAVVYKRSVAPSLMFNSSLAVAGEDCLFLFQLIEKCRRLCCSSKLLVTLADGVNIYAGNYSWDREGHLIQQMAFLLTLRMWRNKLSLSQDNKLIVDTRIRKGHKLFAFLTIRYALKYRRLWSVELIKTIRQDSGFWRWYLFYVLYVVILYPIKLYNPLRDKMGLTINN